MKTKREYPLQVLTDLKRIYDLYHKDFNVARSGDMLMVIREKSDQTPPFYFNIIKFVVSNSKTNYEFEYFPSDSTFVRSHTAREEIEGVLNYIKSWLSYSDQYSKPHPLFDDEESDPILEAYIEEIEDFFDMQPEESDSRPYGILEQVNIRHYTEQIVKIAKENRTEQNAVEVDDIVNDAESIKEDLGRSTKGEIKARFKKLYAKSLKVSVELLKEITKTVIVELVKDAVTGGKLLQLLSGGG